MPDDLHKDIGRTLCAACEMSKRSGQQGALDLAQEALKVAGEEMGALPPRETCPLGGPGEPGCPLIRRDG